MSFLSLRAIPYYPELSEELGNDLIASIIMTQLEFWFKKNKMKAFYKFLEPSKKGELNQKGFFQNGYKDGDSWTEELKISAKSFRRAFSVIGISYKSKGKFMEEKNKFINEGKEYYYCCYTDKMTTKTYYYRNNNLIKQLMDKLTLDIIPENNLEPFPSSRNCPKGILVTAQREVTELPKGKSPLLQESTTRDYNNITTTNLDNINNIEQDSNQDKEKNSSSSNSLKIKEIKTYLMEQVKDVKTCKNIIQIINSKNIEFERIKDVVSYANKNQKGLGFIVNALKDDWVIETKKNVKREYARGQKVNTEAINNHIEAEKNHEEFNSKRENLNNIYENLDNETKKKIDDEAYQVAVKEFGVVVAKTMTKTITKYKILEKYYLEA